eukprot:6195286-Pleurochrysis_carterae.AAC.1
MLSNRWRAVEAAARERMLQHAIKVRITAFVSGDGIRDARLGQPAFDARAPCLSTRRQRSSRDSDAAQVCQSQMHTRLRSRKFDGRGGDIRKGRKESVGRKSTRRGGSGEREGVLAMKRERERASKRAT